MKKQPTHAWWRSISLLAAVAMVVAACGGAAKPKPIIKLAENPWSASSLNVNVAKILLEKQLGYTVEIVSIDENAQFPALAKGDLSASLEVWPSGHAGDITQYVNAKLVDDLGLLGPTGRIGWFMPAYVAEDHPEMATWEGLKNPEIAKLFATAETGDKGQFITGDPSYVQYDADIIKNLGLNFQVVQAGSEQALLSALDASYSRRQPILFYLWTPHSAFNKYELVKLDLPAYTPDCYANADSGGVACDYPPDELFKIGWPGLQAAAPDAYQFLKNFNYTIDDQLDLMARMEANGGDAAKAAQAWVDANEAKWKAWIPAK
jgi:glycine betaine/proline transport system substrate-binding protein